MLIKKLIEYGFDLDQLPEDLRQASLNLRAILAEDISQKTELLDKVTFDSISTLFPTDPAVQKVQAEDDRQEQSIVNNGFATHIDEGEVEDRGPDDNVLPQAQAAAPAQEPARMDDGGQAGGYAGGEARSGEKYELWFEEKGPIDVYKAGAGRRAVLDRMAWAMGAKELKYLYHSEEESTFELVGENLSAHPIERKMQERFRQQFRIERMGIHNAAVVHIPTIVLRNTEMMLRYPRLTPFKDGGEAREGSYEAELEMGIKVEQEHKDLYDFLVSKIGELPLSERALYEMIAKSHLRELPNYYTLLAEMERNAKKNVESNYDSELKKGIEAEREHKDVYDFLIEKLGSLPISEEDFYKMIAEAHLRELPNYYTLLDAMESDAKENVLLDRESTYQNGGEPEKFLGGGKLILDENEKKNKLLRTLQIVLDDLHKLMDTRPLTESEERLLWETRKILAVYTVQRRHPEYGPSLMEYMRPHPKMEEGGELEPIPNAPKGRLLAMFHDWLIFDSPDKDAIRQGLDAVRYTSAAAPSRYVQRMWHVYKDKFKQWMKEHPEVRYSESAVVDADYADGGDTDEVKEHDSVILNEVVTEEDPEVPAGARGTIVHIYPDNAAYEVEFYGGKLLTLKRGQFSSMKAARNKQSKHSVAPSRYNFEYEGEKISSLYIEYPYNPTIKDALKDLQDVKSQFKVGSQYNTFAPAKALIYHYVYGSKSGGKVLFVVDPNADLDRIQWDEPTGKFSKGRKIITADKFADGGQAGNWTQIEQNEKEFEATMKYLGVPKAEWEKYRQDFMADGGEFEGPRKDKRYSVEVDFYEYAKDDEEVKAKAAAFVNEMRGRLDNQAQVLSIHEAPFGSMRSRKLENVPRYNDGGEAGKKKLPEVAPIIPPLPLTLASDGAEMQTVEYRTKHGMEADLDVDSSLDIEEVRRVVENACKPQEFSWFTYKGSKVQNIH